MLLLIMNKINNFIKSLPIILGIGSNVAIANTKECNNTASLQTANSFINLPGIKVVDQTIIQPSLAIQCGSYKAYSTLVETKKGDLDSYVIGAMKLFPIKNKPLSIRVSLDHLSLNNANKDITRARVGMTYKNNIFNFNVDHWELLDGYNRGFTKWNISKGWAIENKSKINASIGGSLNQDFSFNNQHYATIGFSHSLTNSVTIYGKYTHQIEPVQSNQYIGGISFKF